MPNEEIKTGTAEAAGVADGSQQEKSTPTGTPDPEIEQARALLARLKEAGKDFNDMAPEEYLDMIEDAAFKNASQTLSGEPPKATPPAKPPAESQPAAPAGGDQLQQVMLANAQAKLSADWAEFRMDNKDLSREEATDLKRKLGKIITEDAAIVTRVAAKRFEGNLFAAAHHIHQLSDPERAKKLREEGANSEIAKNRAKDSANLETGGRSPAPDTTTAAEKAQKAHDQHAAFIAQSG